MSWKAKYNTISEQIKSVTNNLTSVEWNFIINVLKEQANNNTKGIEEYVLNNKNFVDSEEFKKELLKKLDVRPNGLDPLITEDFKINSIYIRDFENVINNHINNKKNPHEVTANQVGAYSILESDKLLLDKVDKVKGKQLSTNDYTNEEKSKLGGIENGAQVNPYNKNELDSKFNSKVDKVEGKQLSTNDYINSDKFKVDKIITTGNGIKFLNDKGEYIEIDLSGSVKINGNQTINDTKNFLGTLLYQGEEVATKQDLSTVFIYKGSVETFDDLPTTNNKIGDSWNVLESGNNYAWDGEKWDNLSGVFDLSEYLKKTELRTIGGQSLIGVGDIERISFGDINKNSSFDFSNISFSDNINLDFFRLNSRGLIFESEFNRLHLDAYDGLQIGIRGSGTTIAIEANGVTRGLIIDGGDL